MDIVTDTSMVDTIHDKNIIINTRMCESDMVLFMKCVLRKRFDPTKLSILESKKNVTRSHVHMEFTPTNNSSASDKSIIRDDVLNFSISNTRLFYKEDKKKRSCLAIYNFSNLSHVNQNFLYNIISSDKCVCQVFIFTQNLIGVVNELKRSMITINVPRMEFFHLLPREFYDSIPFDTIHKLYLKAGGSLYRFMSLVKICTYCGEDEALAYDDPWKFTMRCIADIVSDCSADVDIARIRELLADVFVTNVDIGDAIRYLHDYTLELHSCHPLLCCDISEIACDIYARSRSTRYMLHLECMILNIRKYILRYYNARFKKA